MKYRHLAVIAAAVAAGGIKAQCSSLAELSGRLVSAEDSVRAPARAEAGRLGHPDRQALALALSSQFLRIGPDGIGHEDHNARVELALGGLGSDGAPAIPALVQAIKHARDHDGDDGNPLEDYYGGLAALSAIGAPAVPALRAFLKDAGKSADAVRALGEVGPGAKDATADLDARLASSPDPDAAMAIILIGIEGLTKEQRARLYRSAMSIGDAYHALPGPVDAMFLRYGAEAFPVVLDVLEHFPEERRQAVRALGAIGPAAASAAPTAGAWAAESWRKDKSEDAKLALTAIARMGPGARAALPDIEAIILLSYGGRGAPEALRAAEAVDPAAFDSWIAREIAGGEHCKELMPLVSRRVKSLHSAAPDLAKQAAHDRCGGVSAVAPVLAAMGRDGAAPLMVVLAETDPKYWLFTYNRVGEALEKMGAEAEPAIPELVKAIRRYRAGATRTTDSGFLALRAIGTPAAVAALKEFE